MNNVYGSIELEPGYKTIVTIKPTQYLTTDSFKQLDLKIRKCRYKHELPEGFTFFKIYTQRTCEFMCALKNMTSHNNITCIPWDMPTLNDDIPVCNGHQTYKFFQAFKEYIPAKDPNCQCLPDCEKITYQIEQSNQRFREENMCDVTQDDITPSLLSDYDPIVTVMVIRDIASPAIRLRNVYDQLVAPDHELVRYDNILWQLNHWTKHCMKKVSKQYAYLIVQIREPNMVQVIYNVKVSFSEKLGIAGGTIGLFTGISLISVIEAAYWIIRGFIEAINKIVKSLNVNKVKNEEDAAHDAWSN